ncbi:cyclic nucleotide-binding protein [Polymorphobacter glacialis]|uniref:Cyclic nucleotide-binding protein n=1 Tax=Sandarakinorhabdus glacialis TaxID=1614636 RepID=A0A916ZP02_9SPHN|nr:Crp/Fnr family transcriptional regulator [Polymorphobacter glacialis]GGE07113.1 cyclic nucleotide-binding protein [Polymorphobacter glacialis]
MPSADFAALAGHFRRIELPVRLQLHEAGRKIDHVFFPEDGLVSIVAVRLDGASGEVGLFGREGMSETATVLATDYSPHEAYVQIAGTSAIKLPVALLNDVMASSPTLHHYLLHYVQAMMVQLSSTIAASNLSIEQRLARWLLMCHDRVDGDDLRVTHEFLGMMLGVRRAGVTVALGKLAGRGLVTNHRSDIRMLDRSGMEALAAGGYGLAEAEYERLIGCPLDRGKSARLAA